MYLKLENFTMVTGTTVDSWPLMTADVKAMSVMLTASTGVPFYIGGSAMTVANGFPVRPNVSTTDEDTFASSIHLTRETFGMANAEISLNQIYVRTTTASQTIYGLYMRRDDDD